MNLSDLLTLSVVSHGHGELVEKLVAQLDELPALRGVHLLLTLNKPGEQFALQTMPLRHLTLEIIRNPEPLGFGANHNQAFEKCRTPWFAILNPDLSITADVFTPLVQFAQREAAALVAPRVVNSAGVQEDSVRWNLTPWSLFKRKLRVTGEADATDGKFRWFAGMFYIVSSDAYRKIGGFDPRYFLYCEDYDLCARMRLARNTVRFVEDVPVVHDARRQSWKSKRYLVMHVKSMLRVWTSSPVWRIALLDLISGVSRRPVR